MTAALKLEPHVYQHIYNAYLPSTEKLINQDLYLFTRSSIDAGAYKRLTVEELRNEETSYKRYEVSRILLSIKSFPTNWDKRGSKKPKKDSIDNAQSWLTRIFNISNGEKYDLSIPTITADESGWVCCEWWLKDKKLTLDFYKKVVDWTQIENIDNQPKITMGKLKPSEVREKLDWLFNYA